MNNAGYDAANPPVVGSLVAAGESDSSNRPDFGVRILKYHHFASL